MPERVIVKLEEGASTEDLEALNRGIGARTEERIAPHILPTLYTVKLLPGGPSVERAIRQYEASPAVAYAEPDYIVTHASDDPYYADGSLWGLNNTGQSSGTPDADIDAPEAWDVPPSDPTSGEQETVVAVIDEGVQHTHDDLEGNVWTNPGETAENGIDDDNNGYVDDIHGWDFYSNNNSTYDGTGDDHGTHVAGTIGAMGNNKAGVVGVNHSKVKIITAKFLGPNGGSTSNAIKALDYVTDLKLNRGVNNLGLTSNSWGGGGYSQGLHDAIKRAGDADILFVAAAGNGGSDGVGDDNDATPHYPSSYDLPNVIAVAATNRKDNKTSFSNYGATSVDLGAPGAGIYSTIPDNSYGSYSGTSMATPHVSGALALLMSKDPTLLTDPKTTDDGHIRAKGQLFDGVDPVPSLQGKTVTGGRLNVTKALGVVPPPEVKNVNPTHAATGAAPNANVTAAFSEEMDPATLNTSTVTLVEDGTATPLAAAVTVSADGKTATLDPDADLKQSTTYTATVKGGSTGVMSNAGKALVSDKVWYFTTADTTAPQVESVSPSNAATGVLLGTNVTAAFSEEMDPATVTKDTFTLVKSGSTKKLSATVSYDAASRTAKLDPYGSSRTLLSKCTKYKATVKGGSSGVKDKAGNPLAADEVWYFTTKC